MENESTDLVDVRAMINHVLMHATQTKSKFPLSVNNC